MNRRGLKGRDFEVQMPDHLSSLGGVVGLPDETSSIVVQDGTGGKETMRCRGSIKSSHLLTRRGALIRLAAASSMVLGWFGMTARSASAACASCGQCVSERYECYVSTYGCYRIKTKYRCNSGFSCYDVCGTIRIYDDYCRRC